jgi:PKD repeat protein
VAEAGSDISAVINEPVLFDGSESADPESDSLSYNWDFGDRSTGQGVTPTHQYQAVGSYTVTLTVSDGELTASDSLAVSVAVADETPTIPDEPNEESEDPPVSPHQPDRTNTNSSSGHAPVTMSGKLRLTEVFPNPDGSDQAGEFIELYNADKAPIPLAGWTISDGKRTISLPETSTIGIKKFLSLPYSTSHLFLNNSGGILKLIDPFGLTISNVAYPEAASGQSFARTVDLKRWQWTANPTPGEANKFSEASAGEPDTKSETDDSGNVDDGATTSAGVTTTKTTPTQSTEMSAEELADAPARTLVRLTGTVVVAPGMFSVSSFWIVSNGLGVEVASSAKDFPKLALGDQVEVIGRTSDSGIGLRINLQKKGATIQSTKSDLMPIEVEISELTEEAIGQFVKIEGSISELKGTQFSVTDEAGDPAQVVLKRGTGVKTDKLSNGQRVSVVGLVGTGGSGLQIWPRVAEDIKAITDDSTGEVLGATTEQQSDPENSLAVESKKSSVVWPTVFASALCLGIGAWFYLRWRKKTKQEENVLGT